MALQFCILCNSDYIPVQGLLEEMNRDSESTEVDRH